MSFYEILIYQTKTIKRKQYLIYFDYLANMKNITMEKIKEIEKLIDSSPMYDWNERDELIQKVMKMSTKDRNLFYNLLKNAK
jgi:hypothetical protein